MSLTIERISSLPYGNYEDPPIEFSKYNSSCFKPTLITKRETMLFSTMGCGLSAVYTLTGISPPKLIRKCIDKGIDFCKGTSAEELIWLLREYGYTALPITVRDVCPKKKLIEELITDQHVLLSAQWVARNELSWFISWDNLEFHSFAIRPVNHRMAINNPIDRSILIHHPSWHAELPALPNERINEEDRNPIIATAVLNGVAHLRTRIIRLREQLTQARIDADHVSIEKHLDEYEKIETEMDALNAACVLFKKA